jgi:predicted TPR repeat methyltransferase
MRRIEMTEETSNTKIDEEIIKILKEILELNKKMAESSIKASKTAIEVNEANRKNVELVYAQNLRKIAKEEQAEQNAKAIHSALMEKDYAEGIKNMLVTMQEFEAAAWMRDTYQKLVKENKRLKIDLGVL